MAIDFKKTQKELYQPKTQPSVIEVPEMTFIMIDGKGNPNTSAEYKAALEILYGLSYGIKMSKMGDAQPEGYFDFVVPPLEGLWWSANFSDMRRHHEIYLGDPRKTAPEKLKTVIRYPIRNLNS